jgi:hypothetical protein
MEFVVALDQFFRSFTNSNSCREYCLIRFGPDCDFNSDWIVIDFIHYWLKTDSVMIMVANLAQ